MVNIGVALICWVGSNSLFDQSSWLMMIIVLESLCVIASCAQFMTYGRVSMFVMWTFFCFLPISGEGRVY